MAYGGSCAAAVSASVCQTLPTNPQRQIQLELQFDNTSIKPGTVRKYWCVNVVSQGRAFWKGRGGRRLKDKDKCEIQDPSAELSGSKLALCPVVMSLIHTHSHNG